LASTYWAIRNRDANPIGLILALKAQQHFREDRADWGNSIGIE